MDKAYEYAKSAVVNFKLDRCCCLAPVRVGVLIIGYFNLFIAVLSLMGTADGGITPPLMEVQEAFLEDNASKPAGILAYSSELVFSTVLLCAMYRNDIVLLRAYVYYTIVEIIAAVLIYSMVIVAVSLLTKMVIIGNIVFNGYVILLVRSAIVEIKESTSNEQNGHVVLYSVVKTPSEEEKSSLSKDKVVLDAEAVGDEKKEPQEIKPDEKPAQVPATLETVSENRKEE
ncbi:unnamed protein product, partial [Brenthis ino]